MHRARESYITYGIMYGQAPLILHIVAELARVGCCPIDYGMVRYSLLDRKEDPTSGEFGFRVRFNEC